jgi:hypothetical protein
MKTDMKKVVIYLSLHFLVTTFSFGQDVPPVKFNHFYFVIEPKDLLEFLNSDFAKNELAVIETRTTKSDNGQTWTGTYLYGSDNYFELFDSSGVSLPSGISGLAFSVDKVGEADILKRHLDNKYKTVISDRERDFDGVKVPWFTELYIDDSTFNAKSNFGFWVMEYKKEYFDYKKIPYNENTLTRENYLLEKEANRKTKVLRRFSGIVMKLTIYEREFLVNYFNEVKFKRTGENEWVTPDNFSILIKNRNQGDNKTIESIEFETNRRERREVKVTDNLSIFIDGDKGRISFR